jgi:hypothetical protein
MLRLLSSRVVGISNVKRGVFTSLSCIFGTCEALCASVYIHLVQCCSHYLVLYIVPHNVVYIAPSCSMCVNHHVNIWTNLGQGILIRFNDVDAFLLHGYGHFEAPLLLTPL